MDTKETQNNLPKINKRHRSIKQFPENTEAISTLEFPTKNSKSLLPNLLWTLDFKLTVT